MGVGPETGGKVFDPYGFSTMGGDKTLAFFRHAEIKHGRVAMAGIVGLLFHINHIHFSGYLSPTFGVSFEDLSNMGPFDAWNAVPLLGQLQASAADQASAFVLVAQNVVGNVRCLLGRPTFKPIVTGRMGS